MKYKNFEILNYNKDFLKQHGRRYSKITCEQCGFEYMAHNNTIKSRYEKHNSHYCQFCVPKQSDMVNDLKYSLALRNSTSDNNKKIETICEQCSTVFSIGKTQLKNQIKKNNEILCNSCFRKLTPDPRSKVKIICDECNKEFTISYERASKRFIKYNKHLCLSCSKSGKNNPFYGKTFSNESLQKISNSKKEFYNSEKGKAEKEKQSLRQLTLLKPIYILDENEELILTTFRDQIILRDNFICKKCNKEYDDILLEIHHLDCDKNKRFDFNNVITLCTKCHRVFHILYGYGNNTENQFNSFLNEGSETIENAANRLKVSRVVFKGTQNGRPR